MRGTGLPRDHRTGTLKPEPRRSLHRFRFFTFFPCIPTTRLVKYQPANFRPEAPMPLSKSAGLAGRSFA